MEKAGEKRLKAVPWKPLQGARSASELLDILQREAIVGVLGFDRNGWRSGEVVGAGRAGVERFA
jgi:hypothetical protein